MPSRGEVLFGEERNLRDELIKSEVPKKYAMAFCLKSIRELQKQKTKISQLIPGKQEDMFIFIYPFQRIDPDSYQADQAKLKKKQFFDVRIFDFLGLAAGVPERSFVVSTILPV